MSRKPSIRLPLVAELVSALEFIAELGGRCLMGNPDAGDDYGQGYRSGSNAAFEQCAAIAKAALERVPK